MENKTTIQPEETNLKIKKEKRMNRDIDNTKGFKEELDFI